jgi:CMP-N,N'-diacetyllegionaminic acid synthase
MLEKRIVAIIPARGGSKGIPHKNIIDLKGFPLIAYSIAAARLSKSINRIIVSTDDIKIAKIAEKFGAEIPFLRPREYSTSKSTDLEFVQHALSWFQKNEGKVPDYLVHLRPTTPLRKPEMIDKAVKTLIKTKGATALRSVHEIRESPYKLFGMKNNYLKGLFPGDSRSEYYNLPRQSFPPVYQPNGYVDVLVTSYVLKSGKMHGNKILGFVTEDAGEIDKIDDLEMIQYLLGKNRYDIFDYLKNNF